MNAKTFIIILFSSLSNAMDNASNVLSLKVLSANFIANNLKLLEKSKKSNIPLECKELIKMQIPITRNNIWEILAKNKREKECLDFLINLNKMQSTPTCMEKLHINFLYALYIYVKDFYSKDYYLEKIKKYCKKQGKNPKHLERHLEIIAQSCANYIEKKENKYFDQTSAQ